MSVETHSADLLAATEFLDHDSPAVAAFVDKVLKDCGDSPTEKAIALYYAVRDRILYEVYGADLSRSGLRASAILEAGQGFCVHKSIVYAAACRAAGIPSRLVMTDVRNHLASPRLRELVGGDVFRFHALTSVYLNGKWVRATPVFNRTLCRLYGITPLEFDGTADSMYHPYDRSGRRYMEFLHEHGEFDDFPYELVVEGIRAAHPRLFESRYGLTGGSLVTEAEPVAGAEPAAEPVTGATAEAAAEPVAAADVAEPAGSGSAALADPATDLAEQLDTCTRELAAARDDVRAYTDYCRRAGLGVDGSIVARLQDCARHAEQRIATERRALAPVAGLADHAEQAQRLAAAEAVLRFGLATLAYVRGAIEWCSASYAQSRTVQFFDTGAQDSPTVNYERYENREIRRVEQQLLDVLGLPADRHAVTVTSSGVAAYSVVEAFLVRHRLRPGDTVLVAPYIYFEAAEQLEALPFVTVERAGGFDVDQLVADVARLRPRCVFVDPVTNTARQRMVDLEGLLGRLRSVVTERTTVVIDGTMVSGGLPPQVLTSDDKVEVVYYESCSKYLQLGLDAGMAGLIAYPVELRDAVERQRRNTGSILYRHGANLFPCYDRALFQRRMRRIGANAQRLATLLQRDPRIAAAGRVYHPALADHPDAAIAARLPYPSGCVTFLFHDDARNDRDELNWLFDDILATARVAGVHLTKGASFGFSVPRVSAADAFDGEPVFLRLYAGDRGEQVDALADAVAQAVAGYRECRDQLAA